MILVLDTFSPGFEMPKSAASGDFSLADINGSADVSFVKIADESVIFSVSGSKLFDGIEVRYSEFNGEISIDSINYYRGGGRIWSIQIDGEQDSWTVETLKSDKVFEITFGEDPHFHGAVNRDVFYAGPGDNFAVGNDGNDLISGDAGNDELYGGFSRDKVLGGSGDDLVSGSQYREGDLSPDTLFGNEGRDTFSFIKNCGSDTIRDFSRKNDTILLDDEIVAKKSEIEDAAKTYNKGVMLKFSSKEIIKIEGLKPADLDKVKFDIEHFY